MTLHSFAPFARSLSGRLVKTAVPRPFSHSKAQLDASAGAWGWDAFSHNSHGCTATVVHLNAGIRVSSVLPMAGLLMFVHESQTSSGAVELNAAPLCCKVLGKRLGKAMGAVGKAVQEMTAAQIAEFSGAGTIELAGHRLEAGDIKARRLGRIFHLRVVVLSHALNT